MSSHRVGPTYDTLTMIVQPWTDRTTYRVSRVHFDGSQRTDTRISSGNLLLSPRELARITPIALIERVLATMYASAQPSAPPQGDMGEQLTLNLDLSA